MIWNAIMSLVWFIFIQGPLYLISAFSKVLEYLTGGIINDLLFGSQDNFQFDKIPMQFWWFVIIAICIFALIFTIQMIILVFQEAAETKKKFVLAIQSAIKAFLFMFLIPIFFFIANFIIQSLASTVINNFGNGGNIANYLWHVGDPTWDGTDNGVPGDYGPPDNIGEYNIMVQLFGTWFMLIAILLIGIILIQKVIELFFLFIISPVVMIVMVIDNGKAAFTWKDMVIAKFLVSTGTLISYYIFISAIQTILKSNLSGLDADTFAKSLFLILFLCGGGLATIAFCDIVAAFVGEGAGLREARSSFRSTLRAGMMAVGAGAGIRSVAGKAIKNINEIGDKFRDNPNDKKTINDIGDSAVEKSRLNFNPFRDVTNTMSSRSGIVGLAGKSLGAFGSSLGHTTAKTIKTFNKVAKKNKRGKPNTIQINANNSLISSNRRSKVSQNEIKINRTSQNSKSNQHSKFNTIKINNNNKINKKMEKITMNNLSPQEKYLIELNKKIEKFDHHAKKSNKKSENSQDIWK